MTKTSVISSDDIQNLDSLIAALQQLLLSRKVDTLPEFEDETLQQIAKQIEQLAFDLDELNRFAMSISSGEFDKVRPHRHNYISGNLKDLQGRLMHLTWQAQQVAGGDYGQRVDFMGDFSIAFNFMVEKLGTREQQLIERIQQSVKDRERLAQTNDIMLTVLDNTAEWVFVSQPGDRELLYSNTAAKQVAEDPTHKALMEAIYAFDFQDEAAASYWELCSDNERAWYGVYSKRIRWIDEQEALLHVISDTTEQKLREESLRAQASTDSLTGLYNRHGLDNALSKACSEETSYCVTLCFIDIDGLKIVNDNHGHAAGDEMLILVADILKDNIRSNDIVARVGGDEFVIAFFNCSKERAEEIAQRFVASLKERNESSGRSYSVGISYGLAYSDDCKSRNLDVLLEEADANMYVQKQQRKAQRAQNL